MLRPYQLAALDQVRAHIRQGCRRILLVSPTGSGKTTIAAEMIRSAVAKGNTVLFGAHRRELVEQARDRLAKDHGIASGILMAGHARRDEHAVQVGSIQTMIRRTIAPARILVADEAHHAAADSWKRLIEKMPAAILVGLTATPWRMDNRGLKDLFDAVVVAATPQELLAQGYLCRATGHAYVSPDFASIATKGGDYDPVALGTAYKQSAVLGDIVDRWFSHASGKRTILFASTIENSQDLCDRFRSRGVDAEHLDYHVQAKERRAIIARVRSGQTMVISNVGILGEGIDVPELECVILARPTKSLAVYLQQVGRVLRPATGKDHAIIHDHAGCIAGHGFWDATRDYSLTASRKKADSAPGVRQCPQCFLCSPAGTTVCPDCGYEWPVAATPEHDGAHQELTLDQLRELERQGDTPAAREAFKRSLVEVAVAKRWKPGAVVHKYLERYPGSPKPWGIYREAKRRLAE